MDWTQWPHFTIAEMMCKCGCGNVDMSPALLDRLEAMRFLLDVPLMIQSGYRCNAHNVAVGSKSKNHVGGWAVDVRCTFSIMRLSIVDTALRCGFRRIGIHSTFIHLDVTPDAPDAIWIYT